MSQLDLFGAPNPKPCTSSRNDVQKTPAVPAAIKVSDPEPDDDQDDDEIHEPTTLVIVGCGKDKRDEEDAACDLYTGALFKKARAYAEQTLARLWDDQGQDGEWFVLSAKHGLLDPATVIEPYQLSLADLDKTQRATLGAQIAHELDGWKLTAADRVIVLAGKAYAGLLPDNLAAEVIQPMAGMQIGERLRWLNEQIGDEPEDQPDGDEPDAPHTVKEWEAENPGQAPPDCTRCNDSHQHPTRGGPCDCQYEDEPAEPVAYVPPASTAYHWTHPEKKRAACGPSVHNGHNAHEGSEPGCTRCQKSRAKWGRSQNCTDCNGNWQVGHSTTYHVPICAPCAGVRDRRDCQPEEIEADEEPEPVELVEADKPTPSPVCDFCREHRADRHDLTRCEDSCPKLTWTNADGHEVYADGQRLYHHHLNVSKGKSKITCGELTMHGGYADPARVTCPECLAGIEAAKPEPDLFTKAEPTELDHQDHAKGPTYEPINDGPPIDYDDLYGEDLAKATRDLFATLEDTSTDDDWS